MVIKDQCKFFAYMQCAILLLAGVARATPASSPYFAAEHDLALVVQERAQEEQGYASGFSITDVGLGYLVEPFLEVGAGWRLISGYGPGAVLNFTTVTTGGASPANQQSPSGYDQPVIRARQLIYGDFHYGRWYIFELGIPVFNVSGFTAEYYRYWSQRIGLHEALDGRAADADFEIGATIRSLSQFAQPQNTGLAYPPTVDAMAGVHKLWREFHLGTDLKIEQALAETAVAGSYDVATNKPYGASTRLVFAIETGWQINANQCLHLRGARRVFRWPDDDNAALWTTFDEASLGQSLELSWRGEW